MLHYSLPKVECPTQMRHFYKSHDHLELYVYVKQAIVQSQSKITNKLKGRGTLWFLVLDPNQSTARKMCIFLIFDFFVSEFDIVAYVKQKLKFILAVYNVFLWNQKFFL